MARPSAAEVQTWTASRMVQICLETMYNPMIITWNLKPASVMMKAQLPLTHNIPGRLLSVWGSVYFSAELLVSGMVDDLLIAAKHHLFHWQKASLAQSRSRHCKVSNGGIEGLPCPPFRGRKPGMSSTYSEDFPGADGAADGAGGAGSGDAGSGDAAGASWRTSSKFLPSKRCFTCWG